MTTDALMNARTAAGVAYAQSCHATAAAYIELRALETALQNAHFGMAQSLGPTAGTEGPHFPAHPKYLRDRMPGSPGFGDQIKARLDVLLRPDPVPATPAPEPAVDTATNTAEV